MIRRLVCRLVGHRKAHFQLIHVHVDETHICTGDPECAKCHYYRDWRCERCGYES